MKRLLVAVLVFPAVAAAIAVGCNGKPQGIVSCDPLVDGGVCFVPPAQVAARTECGDVTTYCDTTGVTTPNLACLTAPMPPAVGAAPATVTLTGFAHVSTSGPDSNNVRIQVFEATAVTQNDPAQQQALGELTTTLDPTTQRACDADAAKGCSIPLANGCASPVCNDGLDGRRDDMKYCRDNGAGGECSDRLRWEARYSLANISTNKQLVIRVTGPNNKSDSVWATTVAFNIFLSTSDRACKSLSDTDCLDLSDPTTPTYQLDVSALSAGDYVKIPTLSGLSSGITAGMGGIAGEVRDCDNVRVANVAVVTTPEAARFTYFNGNPVQTLPDASRAALGTDRLGLFAAWSVKPGAVTVQAAGGALGVGDGGVGVGDGGLALQSFGSFDAFVYANAVSIVNINGGKGTR